MPGGVPPLFPWTYGADNRLMADTPMKTASFSISTQDTTGREHVVLIAVPAKGPPTNFTFLAQPTLAQARGIAAKTRGGEPSPFEKLLESAAFGHGGTRGIGVATEPPVMETRSWVVRN